jgi:hypothetical protein
MSSRSSRPLRVSDRAFALAEDLGDDGEVVGVDASAEMVTVAQNRASAARCHVRFAGTWIRPDRTAAPEPRRGFLHSEPNPSRTPSLRIRTYRCGAFGPGILSIDRMAGIDSTTVAAEGPEALAST